jgi:hypothetical protein
MDSYQSGQIPKGTAADADRRVALCRQGVVANSYIDTASDANERKVRTRRVIVLAAKRGFALREEDIAAGLKVSQQTISNDLSIVLPALRAEADRLGLREETAAAGGAD